MGVRFQGIKPFAPNRLKAGTQILLPIWQTPAGSLGTFTEGDTINVGFSVNNSTSVVLQSGELPGNTRFETAPLSVLGNNTFTPGGLERDFEFTLRAINQKGSVDRTFLITMIPNGAKWYANWDDSPTNQYTVDLGTGDPAQTEVDQVPTNKWYVTWDDTSTNQYTADLGSGDPAQTEVDQVETNKWYVTWDDTSTNQYTVDLGTGDPAQTEVDQVETNKWYVTWDDTTTQQYTLNLGSGATAQTEVDQVPTNKWYVTWDDSPTTQYTVDLSGSGTADL
jgi:phenylpyruvate tautomerase PptA (4-oxalocrotonate tautomerase family)